MSVPLRNVSTYDAKTHFSALVERAQHGETIVITKHGKPVAKLAPIVNQKPVGETIAELRKIRQGMKLAGISTRELVDEGRRF